MSEEKKLNESIMRNQIADYINLSKTATDEYEFMGRGFASIDENSQVQIEKKTYICDNSATSTIKSYDTQFPFDTELMKSEKAVMAIYDVGRNHLTGGEAEFDYVRAELFKRVGETGCKFEARKFRVSCEVSSTKGVGGEIIKMTGNLNGVGDFIDGVFDTVAKTFTALSDATPTP